MAELQDRIQTLKRRWEADPSSRVFVQLAEEYRQRGLLAEALEVLESGIKEHPTYPSALVSLGRCYLELGRPEAACTALEQVVQQDATHMVANKLLVETYLELGRADAARERLRHYSLLNDGDPEIEQLEQRISELARPPSESEPPGAGEMVTAEVDEATGPAEPLSAPLQPEGRRIPGAVSPGPSKTTLGTGEEPFADLGTAVERQRYLKGLTAEGLFPLSESGNGGQLEGAGPGGGGLAPAGSPPSRSEVGHGSMEASREELDAVAPPTGEEGEVAEVQGAQASGGEPAVAGEIETELEVDDAGMAVATDEVGSGKASSEAASVTLGKMYLEQGHLEMAERAFRQVLSRQPDDEMALDGLQEVGRRRAGGLTGRQLLGDSETPQGGSDPAAKKIHVLKSYLQRIRGSSETDVSRAPDSDQ